MMTCIPMLRILLLLISSVLLVAGDVVAIPDEASIRATLNEVSGVLKAEDASLLEGLNQRMRDLSQSIQHLENLQEKEMHQKKKVQSMLQAANAKQLKDLEDRLQETLRKEKTIREKEGLEQKKLEALLKEKQQQKAPPTENIKVEVTPAMLAERLDTHAILGDSEDEMKRWILSVVQDEIQLYKKKLLDLASISSTKVESTSSSAAAANSDSDCPSLVQIVQTVQQALNHHADDGIGLVDYAQGASVVHWLTSKTYVPLGDTLGSVWWSKFIPQDWERLLPKGWEEWQVGIPSYVYHSLGFMSGAVAPPEAVLQKNTLPGSCWPMEGSSGQIVLKLKNPVVVESISVDHISSKIVSEGKHTSAPKKVKVIGYPQCEDDPRCASTGFDMTDPIEIAAFEYDVEGTSVQTFESHYSVAMASVPQVEPSSAFDNDEDEDDESCEVKTSCSTPPKTPVSAIEVRVLENWGNFDFTCLYRLRVHGEAM